LPAKVAGIPVTTIGEITREKSITLVGPDNDSTPLLAKGWDPFRKKS
jgi:hypothetical protein